MPDSVRLLLMLEDEDAYADVLLDEIRRAGFVPQLTRVRGEEDLLSHLSKEFDFILLDYTSPVRDTLRLLDSVLRRNPDIPAIIVSGAGEETAVAAMQAGAADYVWKDRLGMLGPAVRRALQQRDQSRRWRETERALRDSEERFRLAAETASDVIFEWNVESGEVETLGEPGERFGRRAADLPRTYEGWLHIVHPDDRPRIGCALQRLLATGEAYHEEYRVIQEDGIVRHWAVRAQVLPSADGMPHRVIGSASDITDRVVAQAKVAAMNENLRELSAKLMRLQDEERRRFARELHDSTAQSLTAISLKLSLVSNLREIEDCPEAQKMIAECAPIVESTIREVRAMSYLMHPLLLDDVGLEAAIRNYVSGFEKRTGIPAHFYSSTDHKRWDDAAETTAFRFVQEALSNVHRHAEAGHVAVRLVESRGQLVVAVADDGHGFPAQMIDPAGDPGATGVGLGGMRERARFLGGSLQIQSTSRGSTLQLVIPIHE